MSEAEKLSIAYEVVSKILREKPWLTSMALQSAIAVEAASLATKELKKKKVKRGLPTHR